MTTKELVIIDLDNTLINGQSQKLLLNFLLENKYIGLVYYIKIYPWFILYKLGLIKDPKSVMEYAFKFLRDKDEKDIRKIIDIFFDKKLKRVFFEGMLEIVAEHKRNNRNVIIISNSISVIVGKVADFLGVEYISTEAEILNNVYTGNILGEIVYGKNKVNYLEKYIKDNPHITMKKKWSYADHISDLDVLSIADIPVAVNPDKSLLKKAKQNNWLILNFK